MRESSNLFLAIFAVAALLFCLIPLWLARLWASKYSPRKPGPSKNASYECGHQNKNIAGGGDGMDRDDPWIRFKSEYYLYAMIFLIFDVEAIFVLPFAVAFTELPTGAFVAMIVFLLLLVEGLVWAWRKGVLDWT